MAAKPASPAALLRAAKRACQDARDGRIDEPLLRELADGGEPLAVAACAQVSLFQGRHREAAAYAARYLRAPSMKATGNLFVDACAIVRAAGDEALTAEAAAGAFAAGNYAGLVEASLRTDRRERALLERATRVDARDDELLRRHEARPDLFDWNATLEVAFALLRAGDRAGAARALDADPRRWPAVDAGQVVPVELATHPALAGLWTPARAAYWLASPRGQ